MTNTFVVVVLMCYMLNIMSQCFGQDMNENDIINALSKRDLKGRPSIQTSAPVIVNVSMYSSSLAFEFKGNSLPVMSGSFYYRERWNDPRLYFANISSIKKVSFSDEILKIWHPDTFFVNDYNGKPLEVSEWDHFHMLLPSGDLLYSVKQKRDFECPVDWYYYPYDTQLCQIVLESYGYSTADVAYKPANKFALVINPTVASFEYSVSSFKLTESWVLLSSGNYSRLEINIIFKRIQHFTMELFFAPTCFVLLTWLPLLFQDWLKRGLFVTAAIFLLFLMFSAELLRAFPPARNSLTVMVFIILCVVQIFLQGVVLLLILIAVQKLPFFKPIVPSKRKEEVTTPDEEIGLPDNMAIFSSGQVDQMDAKQKKVLGLLQYGFVAVFITYFCLWELIFWASRA